MDMEVDDAVGSTPMEIDMVDITADIVGANVRLRGTISNTNTHTVTVVRRLMKV